MRAIHLITIIGALLPLREARASYEAPPPPVTPYVERGMLYGKAQGGAAFIGSADTAPEGSLDASVVVAAGVTDRVTLEGALGTVTLAPSAKYKSPGVGVWVGVIDHRRFELDAVTRVTFGVGEGRIVSRVEPGAAAIVRLGPPARLDIGAYLPIEPGGEAHRTTVGARAPLSLGFQLGPYFHTSISSGITLEDLAHAKRSLVVPLSFALGVSAPLRGGGAVGLTPSVSWPRLVDTSGAHHDTRGAPVLGATLSISTP